MRIFNLSIDEKTYPACCGIRALAQLQKKYGSLKEFENKIFSRSEDTEKSENYLDEIDYQALLDTTMLFLEEGAEATGKKAPDKKIVYAVSNPAKLATEIFTTYAGSMFPENENDEKNSESQTEEE
ncbi:MAG: hypothetical protein ACLS49_00270 [Christensenellales bacterium]|jgi:hypothetical protein